MDVSRRLGVEWNSLTPEQKEVEFLEFLDCSPISRRKPKIKKDILMSCVHLAWRPAIWFSFIQRTDDLKRSSRNSTISASRARSAYIYFCNEKREEMRAQNPRNVGMTGLLGRLEYEWNQSCIEHIVESNVGWGETSLWSECIWRQRSDSSRVREGKTNVG